MQSKIFDFANGIPVQEHVDFFDTLKEVSTGHPHHYTGKAKMHCVDINPKHRAGMVFTNPDLYFKKCLYKNFFSSSISFCVVSGVSLSGKSSPSFSYFETQSFLNGKSSISSTHL